MTREKANSTYSGVEAAKGNLNYVKFISYAHSAFTGLGALIGISYAILIARKLSRLSKKLQNEPTIND